jgi:hypothetical protein
MQYKHRPVIVEAVQFKPQFRDNKYLPAQGVYEDAPFKQDPQGKTRGTFYIETPDGKQKITPGDWIITNEYEQRFSCKPLFFEQNYEHTTN